MESSEWGPHFWFTGHAITFYYPDDPTDEEKQAAKNYFYAMAYLMPCDSCCEDYSRLLHESPIDEHLESMEALSLWFYRIHAAVNRKLGKPNQPSYEHVKRQFLKLEPKYKVSDIADPASLDRMPPGASTIRSTQSAAGGPPTKQRSGGAANRGRGNRPGSRSTAGQYMGGATAGPTTRSAFARSARGGAGTTRSNGGGGGPGSGTGTGGCKDCGKGRRRTRYS